MFVKWLKDLCQETWALSLFLAGIVSNVITFVLPSLPALALRRIGISLLGVSFLWANFSVYKRLKGRAAELEQKIQRKDAALAHRDFAITLSVEGNPPSRQLLRVSASEPISTQKLEYLLSDETCIVENEAVFQGTSFDVPISDESVVRIWNLPRIDRNTFDNSGPMKLRLTVSVAGRTRCYTLPASIQVLFEGMTMFRKLTGRQTFHGLI